MPKKLQGGHKGYGGNHSIYINNKLYGRGVIFKYVVSDDDSSIKANLW